MNFFRKTPLKTRLVLGHSITMGLILAALGYGVLKYVEHKLVDSIEITLRTTADGIIERRFTPHPLTGKNPFQNQFDQIERIIEQIQGRNRIRMYGVLINVNNKQSKVAQRATKRVNFSNSKNSIVRARNGNSTFENILGTDGSLYRLLTVPILSAGQFTGELVKVGVSLEETKTTLKNLSYVLWLAVPIALLLSMLVGYFLTRQSLQSVKAISNAANQITSSDLKNRIPLPEANDEIYDLSTTINKMLNRLEDSFTRQQHFSGNVSHELRTSLAVLRGESELALRRERTSEEYQFSLKNIMVESKHMHEIVENLLLLSRAKIGKLQLDKETFQLESLVDKIIETTSDMVAEKKVNIKTDIEGIKELFVSKAYFTIALQNLIINAIKHSKEDHEVVVSKHDTKDWHEIQVVDQGHGIPEKDLPYIFDSVYRADTARNRSAGGAGIGLSLTKALVELHGGKVSVSSELGKGSTFKILLPKTPSV